MLTLVQTGVLDYDSGLKLQNHCHMKVLEGHGGFLIITEHPAVLTLGRQGSLAYVQTDCVELKAKGIDLIHTDRGGEVTAHELGQLVIYPIVLQKGAPWGGVRAFVTVLEQAVINTLAQWGLEAHVQARYPGVWLGEAKICSLGIRMRQRISSHGLALNVNNDLSTFAPIVPCGIENVRMTSMAKALAKPVDMVKVTDVLVQEICLGLGQEVGERLGREYLQSYE